MLSAPTASDLPTPRWSQCAEKSTASDLSIGSLPSTTPITLRVAIFCTVVGICPLMRTPRGIALKPLVSAFLSASSTVSPAMASSFSPPRRDSQPAKARAGASPVRCIRARDSVFTTEYGYPAVSLV